jgi:hypothetical protein
MHRNRIERLFNRTKKSGRVATVTRYNKLMECFGAFVLLASIRYLVLLGASPPGIDPPAPCVR